MFPIIMDTLRFGDLEVQALSEIEQKDIISHLFLAKKPVLDTLEKERFPLGMVALMVKKFF